MIYSSRDDLTGDNSHQSGDEVLSELRTMLPLTANKRFAINYFRRLDAIGFTEVGDISVGSILSQPFYFSSSSCACQVMLSGFRDFNARGNGTEKANEFISMIFSATRAAGATRGRATFSEFINGRKIPSHPFSFLKPTVLIHNLLTCAAHIGVNVAFVAAGSCNSVTHPSTRVSSM
jgi:hypothetical protein